MQVYAAARYNETPPPAELATEAASSTPEANWDVDQVVISGWPVIQTQSANSCCKSPIIKHCAGEADSDRLSLIHAPKPCRLGESD
jgi:hypothetical protein